MVDKDLRKANIARGREKAAAKLAALQAKEDKPEVKAVKPKAKPKATKKKK